MRNRIITIIIGLFFSSSLLGQENIKFSIKSGVIKYHTAGMSKGSVVLYFDDYGNTMCEDFNGVMWDLQIQTRTIVKDGSIYILDMLEKSFTVEKLDLEGMKIYDEFYFEEAKYEENGFLKEGEELVLGKKCNIYSSSSEFLTKIWVWKGLIFKKEDDILGGSIQYATSFEELPSGNEIFEVSADFKKQ